MRGEIGIKVRAPSFKKSREYKSFTLKQAGYRFLDGHRLKIGGRVYKYVKDRELAATPKTVSVKQDEIGNLSLCVSQEVDEPGFRSTSGKMAGFDFGLKTFLTVHDGFKTYKPESPLFFRQAVNEVRHANQQLSRRQKNSNGRKKARIALTRLHKRIADKRRDWFFKLAYELTGPVRCPHFRDVEPAGDAAHVGPESRRLGLWRVPENSGTGGPQ